MKDFIAKLIVLMPDKKQQLNNCFSTRYETTCFIKDDENLGKTVFYNAESEDEQELTGFKISNKEAIEIGLWAIDGCFVGKGKKLSNQYPKKCDCIFGYTQYLGLLELKMNADAFANDKSIARVRTEGVEQLEHTLCYLRDLLNIQNKFIYEDYTVEAFICTPINYPMKSTAIQSLAIEFSDNYGIPLYEVNEKSYY